MDDNEILLLANNLFMDKWKSDGMEDKIAKIN